MAGIHFTAIVDPKARIGVDVAIGPWSMIGADVMIGDGTVIGSHTVIGVPEHSVPNGCVTIDAGCVIGSKAMISGDVTLGRNTRIGLGAHLVGPARIGANTSVFDYVTIGNPGQYPGHHENGGLVEIGDDVVLREQVCVMRPVLTGLTSVGDGSYLMAQTRIDHDCRLGRMVKMASGVTLGGSVVVQDYAYLGMNAVVHQRVRVGAYTMVGMNTSIMGDVPPYAVFFNRRVQRVNAHGLKLRGVADADVNAIERAFEHLARHSSTEHLDLGNTWVKVLHTFLHEGERERLHVFRRADAASVEQAR